VVRQPLVVSKGKRMVSFYIWNAYSILTGAVQNLFVKEDGEIADNLYFMVGMIVLVVAFIGFLTVTFLPDIKTFFENMFNQVSTVPSSGG